MIGDCDSDDVRALDGSIARSNGLSWPWNRRRPKKAVATDTKINLSSNNWPLPHGRGTASLDTILRQHLP